MPYFTTDQAESTMHDMIAYSLREQERIPDRHLMVERVLNESPLYYAASRKLLRRVLLRKFESILALATSETITPRV